jgi:hypothetical protein
MKLRLIRSLRASLHRLQINIFGLIRLDIQPIFGKGSYAATVVTTVILQLSRRTRVCMTGLNRTSHYLIVQLPDEQIYTLPPANSPLQT